VAPDRLVQLYRSAHRGCFGSATSPGRLLPDLQATFASSVPLGKAVVPRASRLEHSPRAVTTLRVLRTSCDGRPPPSLQESQTTSSAARRGRAESADCFVRLKRREGGGVTCLEGRCFLHRSSRPPLQNGAVLAGRRFRVCSQRRLSCSSPGTRRPLPPPRLTARGSASSCCRC
jgi:hypothetical protein